MDCLRVKEKRVRELSQGERQKVLIARALMGRPKLLTLDEPCEGLDMKTRESFLASLSRVARTGETSIVEVTHRTDDIPAGFSHALLLRDGRKVASGQIENVITAKNLSLCFDSRITLKTWRGRYYSVAN
jgi:iron complex transport system ATP-binding protein